MLDQAWSEFAEKPGMPGAYPLPESGNEGQEWLLGKLDPKGNESAASKSADNTKLALVSNVVLGSE